MEEKREMTMWAKKRMLREKSITVRPVKRCEDLNASVLRMGPTRLRSHRTGNFVVVGEKRREMTTALASLTTSYGRPPVRLASPSPGSLWRSLRVLGPKGRATSRPRRGIHCSSNNWTPFPPFPGSEENDSRSVLDAFFLGKAFAEALNERVQSTVGEIVSVVGQWQAEQQKLVQDFQEEVFERAKKAKEKAELEAMGEKGVFSKPLTATSDTLATVSPIPDPKTEDPLQEMLKD